MQEDPDSVTQKFAYNNGLYRYMSSTLVEENTRRAVAPAIEEEMPIESLAPEIEGVTSPTPDDGVEELIPALSEEQTSDVEKDDGVEELIPALSEEQTSDVEKQEAEPVLSPDEEQETPSFVLEEADEQKLTVVDAMPPVDTYLPPFPAEVETPLPSSLSTSAYPVSVSSVNVPQKPGKRPKITSRAKKDAAMAQKIREQCRQLCVSLFFREQSPVRSLGFTSSLHGEGKSFLAMIAAAELAKDSPEPVTLLECNWERPHFHTHFGIAPTPGLAEWLRGECSEMAIRHQVGDNLTVIPAGDGRKDAVKLLQHIRQKKLSNIFGCASEYLIVDLPSIMTSVYGVLAASNVETLVVVVRAGVTPGTLVAETCEHLKDTSVHGLLLNQVDSHVPRWIRQLM